MPRTVDEILAHADQLAKRFEDFEPSDASELDVEAVKRLREAASLKSAAERTLIDAVKTARSSGMTWNSIGPLVGTSGEAARQRYSKLVA